MKTLVKVVGWVLGAALLVALAVALLVLSREETPPDGHAPSTMRLLDARYKAVALRSMDRIREMHAANQWPSMSVAVGIAGKRVWAASVGWADVASGAAVSPEHQYRVGSVAKPMTAVLMGQLLDDGKLSLDDDVRKYVPEFPAKMQVFTLRQLASHTAGIRHYGDGLQCMREHFSNTQYYSVREGLVLFQDDPLLFVPGTQFHYSSYGYNLLSAALESAGGDNYLALMQKRVFARAGMTHTRAEHPPVGLAPDGTDGTDGPDASGRLVTPYYVYEDVYLRAPDVNNSYKWAGGGFVSTPSDLVRFGSALLQGWFVEDNTRQMLWQPVVLADGTQNPDAYALGFRVGDDEGGEFVSHGGSSVGGRSYLAIYPHSGLVVAMAANVSMLSPVNDPREELRDIAREFLTPF